MSGAPILVWIRRELRLGDHEALAAAQAAGAPVIPFFLRDEGLAGLGAAPRWRMGLGVESFARGLEGVGSRLVLRTGDAAPAIRDLAAGCGARAVHWTRSCEPRQQARDAAVEAALAKDGVEARSFPGRVLFEPWTVETGSGGPYRVYTPFWNAVRGREVPPPLPPVAALRAPGEWPDSERLADWRLGDGMRRGAAVVARHARVGEAAALARLDAFARDIVARYGDERDFPAADATSRLSEPLAYGEISPRTVWHAGLAAMREGAPGAEKFLKELAWREFACHLLHHMPELAERNWKPEWDAFAWGGGDSPEARAWRRGRTGIEFVDAAMREMYVTGTMHNRARMIAASYLTKHLLIHWRVGLDWFAECLIDWDPASNAMGWQWVAGSGPDAAPYFRVFNPVVQAGKFDPDRAYRDAWIAEGRASPPETALRYFQAIPESWGMSPDDPYPAPVVTAEAGRARALAAYEDLRLGLSGAPGE